MALQIVVFVLSLLSFTAVCWLALAVVAFAVSYIREPLHRRVIRNREKSIADLDFLIANRTTELAYRERLLAELEGRSDL